MMCFSAGVAFHLISAAALCWHTMPEEPWKVTSEPHAGAPLKKSTFVTRHLNKGVSKRANLRVLGVEWRVSASWFMASDLGLMVEGHGFRV